MQGISRSEINIKSSVFLGFFMNFNNFESMLLELKNEHKKAHHFVYAYRFIKENNDNYLSQSTFDFNCTSTQIIEKCHDANEPKGSAGMGILRLLKGHDLINSAIIVVRYFGGIKLGIGNLARAYQNTGSSVIKDAISKNLIAPYVKKVSMTLECNLTQLPAIKSLIFKLNLKLKESFSGSCARLEISGEESVIAQFNMKLKEINGYLQYH
ncbi:MAG: YigZ family protein [Helicobacter sp.]|nr:YigZ family protein [Helicobacter sp.]